MASIDVNETGPFHIGDVVTFTCDPGHIRGQEYPMVYLAAVVPDGTTVYGQLDSPSASFPLGGGSSPWIDPANPNYHADAEVTAYLYAYSPPLKQHTTIRLLAQTSLGVVTA